MVTCGARIPSVELGGIIPLSELQEQGLCEFRYKDEPFLCPGDIAWCDILWIFRGASSQSVWAAQEAKKLGRLVLGYWDDDLLSVPSHNPNYIYYSSLDTKKNINALFKLTDAFLSPSAKLAAKLCSIQGSEAKVLPGVLGPEAVRRPKPVSDHAPIVGFAGGVVYATELDSLVGPALAAAAASRGNFKVHVVGPKPNFIGRLPVETTYTPPVPKYYDYLALAAELNWDIGLAPQWESEFTTYKFYNKLLEYTYIGCAGIYTRIEPYLGVIEDGITGLLVPNEVAAWRDAILRLLKDPDLRFRIATNAYEFVQAHHSRKVVAERYAEVLAPFLSHRAPQLGKAYLLWNSQVYRFSGIYKLAAEYIRIHGIRRFLRRAPPYAFSLLRQKLTHVSSKQQRTNEQ
jgi:glycosyltransferase involved in cell wall biosynthesis